MGDQSTGDELLAGAAASGLSALVPGGALAQPLFLRLVGAVRREHQRNTSVAWSAATAASGLRREDLQEFVEEDPRGVPLYLLIIYAAGMNGHEGTLRAMGAVFGVAAAASREQDIPRLERADLTLRSMSGLSPQHFEVLRYLTAHEPVVGPDGGKGYGASTYEAIADGTALEVDDVAQYALNLAAAGLVTMQTGLFGGGTGHEATVIGRAVAEAARWVRPSSSN